MKNFALFAALCAPLCAHASPTVYNVNIAGSPASAVGTITTDGNLGVLSTSDILAFDLTLSNGTTTTAITTGGWEVLGSDLTATPSGLFYNFSDVADNFGGFGLPDYLCFSGSGSCNGNGFQGIQIELNGNAYDTAALTTDAQVASLASAATPEPGSVFLLATGALGVLPGVRRRFSRS